MHSYTKTVPPHLDQASKASKETWLWGRMERQDATICREDTVYGIHGFGDGCWPAILGQVVTEWAEHVCW